MPQDTHIKKRSVRISGHDTSITLEQPFWDILKDIAQERALSINALISQIDEKNEGNLSSALRIFILNHLQQKLSEQVPK